MNFDGWINFYDYVDSLKIFTDFHALFVDGNCVEVRKEEWKTGAKGPFGRDTAEIVWRSK